MAEFSTKRREDLGKKGKAFKNANDEYSYPINSVQDLKNAIQAFGRAKDADKPKLKRYIMAKARSLGQADLIPDSWKQVAATASAVGRLEVKLALGHESLNRSPKKNWVENTGQLPAFIQHIAKDLHEERGMPLDRAIATAISRVKVWAAGGDNVKPDTQAKAAAALAEWEALKAKNKARKAS